MVADLGLLLIELRQEIQQQRETAVILLHLAEVPWGTQDGETAALHGMPRRSFSANDEERQLAGKRGSQHQEVLATRSPGWRQEPPLPPLRQRTTGHAATKGSGPSEPQLPRGSQTSINELRFSCILHLSAKHNATQPERSNKPFWDQPCSKGERGRIRPVGFPRGGGQEANEKALIRLLENFKNRHT